MIMKKQYLWAVPALVLLAGCAKSDDTQDQETKTTNKVIVEYLEDDETSDNYCKPIHQRFFSEDNLVFPAAGGKKTIQTNIPFKERVLDRNDGVIKYDFKLFIDDVDQKICTADQSDVVTVDGYPLIGHTSCVRVPSGDQRKVRYSDGTFGYIPDSILTTAYPVAGIGYESYMKYSVELPPMLITGITGPWFKVTTDALEPYTKKEVPLSYFKGTGKRWKIGRHIPTEV